MLAPASMRCSLTIRTAGSHTRLQWCYGLPRGLRLPAIAHSCPARHRLPLRLMPCAGMPMNARWPYSLTAYRSTLGPELCSIQVPPADKGRKGPRISLSLPSFSGGTLHCPQLLQYTCQLATRVGLLPSLHAQVRVVGEWLGIFNTYHGLCDCW